MHNPESGIILYAKKRNLTSFSSLWDIKHALHTRKVGHTGTLDNFADGLLVVLTGSMTHLVGHITDFDKTYEAIIRFGIETDTLDPEGEPVKTAGLPSLQKLEEVLPGFIGSMSQIPPVYSALHIDGKRASDLARKGTIPVMNARPITVHTLNLIGVDNPDAVEYAHIRFCVSKGTYIRSLARDIGCECSSCAHLVKLRRTHVGPFALCEAGNAGELEPFSLSMIASPSQSTELPVENEKQKEQTYSLIRQSLMSMSEEIALRCGFSTALLKKEHEADFYNGKKLTDSSFLSFSSKGETAVFTQDSVFCGLVKKKGNTISYSFVIPRSKKDTISASKGDV